MSSSPHDALFKAVFGQPEHARGALRAVLPAEVVDALDWRTLAPCPGSFVDPALAGRHTDLLFSVAWRGSGEALVYALFEHQSTSDDRMPLRLLTYLVRIWERWLADHPRAVTLPVIVPVVLYHGEAPWSAPLSFDALFEVPAAARAALAPHLVRFAYLLDDLSHVPDDALRARAMTALGRVVEICLKHARTHTDLLQLLTGWAELLREVIEAPDGLEALVQVMRYILLVNEHVTTGSLQRFLERVVPAAKDTIMTEGQRLIDQGKEQGIQLGIQQGKELGIQQGKELGIQQGERGMLLRMLRARFGDQVDGAVEGRLAAASSAEIATWADRVFSAATLTELLGA
jgi:predicted transposase/invertase (TIGR01784 family)